VLSKESLPSVSSENNGLVANSLSLSQNGEYEKDNHFCLTPDCVKAGKCYSFDKGFDLFYFMILKIGSQFIEIVLKNKY